MLIFLNIYFFIKNEEDIINQNKKDLSFNPKKKDKFNYYNHIFYE
jgi:hypothetical protein